MKAASTAIMVFLIGCGQVWHAKTGTGLVFGIACQVAAAITALFIWFAAISSRRYKAREGSREAQRDEEAVRRQQRISRMDAIRNGHFNGF